MTRYQTLLFDADGTLFDYERAEAESLQQTFVQYGVTWQPEFLPLYRQINAEIWALLEQGRITPQTLSVERFQQLLQALSLDLPADAFSAAYLTNIGNCAALIDGAQAVVEALSPHYRIAILTNGLKTVQHSRMARSPIGPHIAELIISEEVGAAKPDPAIFAVALQRLGNPPKSDVLMIGDSLSSDIRGAVNFGLDSCWYNPGSAPRPADLPITYEIKHLNELLTLIR
jgi:YjjG family noncanonical pyrimidine nucleotidase